MVSDVSFRLVLIYMILEGCASLIYDIDTAFLLGLLDTEIFMDCPEGMYHADDECLLLIKTIYGLVQSARLYYKAYRD